MSQRLWRVACAGGYLRQAPRSPRAQPRAAPLIQHQPAQPPQNPERGHGHGLGSGGNAWRPSPGPASRSSSTLPARTLSQTPRPSPTPSGSELTTRPTGRSERTRGDYRPQWFHFEEAQWSQCDPRYTRSVRPRPVSCAVAAGHASKHRERAPVTERLFQNQSVLD